MEDPIEVTVQDYGRVRPTSRPSPILLACLGTLLTGLYGVWSLFALPGFRKIPLNLKVLEISLLCFHLPALLSSHQMLHVCVKAETEHNVHSNNNLLIWSKVLRASKNKMVNL